MFIVCIGPIILGTVLHLGAFAISFINLPFDATIGDTSNEAIMHSDPKLAIFASFLFGSGDAITSTQIYALIGTLHGENSAPAFASFKFFQSLFAAVGFFYSPILELSWQLLILLVCNILAMISFCTVDIVSNRRRKGNNFEIVENKS